jgi:hypothetical protein
LIAQPARYGGMRLVLLVALALGLATERADACACCDGDDRKRPIGWTSAGGALLIDTYVERACEPRHSLQIWPVGAATPSACYDLYGDPQKRIACDMVSTPDDPRRQAKASTRVAHFPVTPTKLDAAKLKILRSWQHDPNGVPSGLLVTVEIEDKRVLRELLTGISESSSVSVTAWPNPRGDRAVLLIGYREQGSGHHVTDVRWVELKKNP